MRRLIVMRLEIARGRRKKPNLCPRDYELIDRIEKLPERNSKTVVTARAAGSSIPYKFPLAKKGLISAQRAYHLDELESNKIHSICQPMV